MCMINTTHLSTQAWNATIHSLELGEMWNKLKSYKQLSEKLADNFEKNQIYLLMMDWWELRIYDQERGRKIFSQNATAAPLKNHGK